MSDSRELFFSTGLGKSKAGVGVFLSTIIVMALSLCIRWLMDLLAHIAPGRSDIRKVLRRVVAQIKARVLCG